MPKVTSIPKSGLSSNIQEIYVVMLKGHKNEIIIYKREKVTPKKDQCIYGTIFSPHSRVIRMKQSVQFFIYLIYLIPLI